MYDVCKKGKICSNYDGDSIKCNECSLDECDNFFEEKNIKSFSVGCMAYREGIEVKNNRNWYKVLFEKLLSAIESVK